MYNNNRHTDIVVVNVVASDHGPTATVYSCFEDEDDEDDDLISLLLPPSLLWPNVIVLTSEGHFMHTHTHTHTHRHRHWHASFHSPPSP